MPPRNRDTAVLSPNLGLYLGIPPISIPKRGLKNGKNFRIKQGRLTNLSLGWTRFGDFTLNGPVLLVDNLILRTGTEFLIFGTKTDLYQYNPNDESVAYITPVYNTGTVDVSGADPAVVTDNSGSSTWDTAGIKAGDEISFGASDETDPDATWYVVDSVDSETQLTLTTAVTGAPLTNQSYTIRQLFSGDVDDLWVSDTFVDADPDDSDLWLATNGVNTPVKWDGTSNHAEFLSVDFTSCRTLKVFSNMVIYGDITQSGERLPATVLNSDVGQPEDTSTGLASQFIVHDGTDPIEALGILGDNLIIYSERHIVQAQFVGDPLVFVFRDAFSGYGPLTGKLVADFGDFHEFIGTDSQYRFDGVTATRVNKHLFRDVLRQRDGNRRKLSFSHFDEENGDLIWVLPLVTDAGAGETDTTLEIGWGEHYLEDVGRSPTPFSKREFPFMSAGYFERQTTLTWDQLTNEWNTYNFRWNDQFFFAAFPLTIVGDIDGKVYELNASQDADGSALESFVHFGRRAMGDGRMRGLLRRVYPFAVKFASADYDLSVTPYLSDHASGTPTAGTAEAFDVTLPEGGHFVSPFRRARFFEIRFGTAGPGEPWELEGYDIDVSAGGRR